jgi:hypothetical protein
MWSIFLALGLENEFFLACTLNCGFRFEKCLVVHSHLTPISLLSIWTNNVRDSGESVVGPIFFNNIIGPSRQMWDKSGIRVYNQAFLFRFMWQNQILRGRQVIVEVLPSISIPTYNPFFDRVFSTASLQFRAFVDCLSHV